MARPSAIVGATTALAINLVGSTVKIKLRWSDFTTITRQVSLPEGTDNAELIEAAALQLLREHWSSRRLVRLIGRISLKSVPARVAAALLEEAEAAGAAQDGGAFALPFTQEELATELSTTRERVSRAIGSLRDEGVLSREGTLFRIQSRAALQEAAGVDPALIAQSLYSSALPMRRPGA